MGKSNGHKWFKTGRKKGVKNFTFERALVRVHVKKVEEKQHEYYRKGKIAVDSKMFPEFAKKAAEVSSSSSSEGTQD